MATPGAFQLVQPSAAQASPALLQALASQMGGVQAIPSIQRSQMLAQALQNIQAHGGQNIRTPTALASNLMADALLQYGQRRQNQALLGAIVQGMNQQATEAQNGIYAPDAPPPGTQQAAPSASSVPPPPLPPPTDASTPAAAPPSTPAPKVAMTDGDRDLLARTLLGEGGDSPADMKATGTVILNRASLAHQGIGDVIHAPHQFEAVDNPATWAKWSAIPTTSPRYQAAMSVVDDLAQNGPSGNFDHFYSPRGQAALGRPMPKWDNGSGQDIGGQRFFALGYGGQPALPGQQGAPGGAQASQVAGAGQPAAQPGTPPQGGQMMPAAYQVPQDQGAPGGGAGGALQSQQQPAGQQHYQAPPTGPYATPQETALIKQGLSYPQGSQPWLQAVELARQVQQQTSGPVEAPKGYYWDGWQGKYVSQTPYQDITSPSPNQFLQRGPDNQLHSTANGAFGALGPNQVMGPNGQVSNLPVQQQPTFKIPGAAGLFTNGPDGRPVKVADDAFGPKEISGMLTDLTKSEEYTKATNATNMYRGAVSASQRPGGMSDAELIDFAAQEISGGVARQFNQKMIENAQGPWARLKQFAPELVSGQRLSPEGRQALLQTMRDYATEAQGAFANQVASRQAFAQQNGFDLSPYTRPLLSPLPDVPGIGQIPNGMPGQGGGQQPGAQQPHAALPPGATFQGVPPGAPQGTVRNQRDGKFYINQGGKWFEWRPN